MTDDPRSRPDDPSRAREPTDITPGVPKTENVVMVMLGVLCTLAVIVHMVVVFT